ncbi:hypothetical protein PIB30_042457 [Stylosanthes scabra]|uniref:GRF-type domain-containing protein n=2 Tax=Stylosanthes scabra TaxID=79078 RepID=A0ABU6VE08_9FABA|nr:hypothetical protein [Stylosanthes scabra]
MEGVSSGSRCSGSGRRGKRSSSSAQCFFASKVRENEIDGVAPKCNCGVYAVLYLSKTTKNPNRLFFGCPLYKSSHNHCNFFLWLDRHLAMFGKKEQYSKGGEDEEDVSEHFAKMKLELRLADLEERVSAIEKKKKRMHMFLIALGIAIVLLSICVSRV